jgi:hypothetical protein
MYLKEYQYDLVVLGVILLWCYVIYLICINL